MKLQVQKKMVNVLPMANSHKCLIVGSMNVRSLYNVIGMVRPTFQNSNFHILGFSETWLNHKIDSSPSSLNNYVLHRHIVKGLEVVEFVCT